MTAPTGDDALRALREALAAAVLAATTDYGTGKAAPDIDLFDFYADAVLSVVAAERAAVARRVLALAEELDAQAADAEHLAEEHRRARNLTQAGVFAGKKVAKRDAAARLRAVVAAALGETGGRQ